MNKTQRVKCSFALIVCMTLFQLGNPGFSEEERVVHQPSPYIQPVMQKAENQVDLKKLALAQELTNWMQNTLQEKRALVAVVARKGGHDIQKHDKTGMAHAGLAVYDPRAQTWLIYNLVQDTPAKSQSNRPTESIWRTAPLDFYYRQTGYGKEALILIPNTETQQKVYASIVDGRYKQLSTITAYNLLSPYDSQKSLNCNKWLLFNLVAAQIDNYDPKVVAKTVHNGFAPATIKLSPIEKMMARHKSSVLASELTDFQQLQVITVEYLYRSGLFMEKIFFSGKSGL